MTATEIKAKIDLHRQEIYKKDIAFFEIDQLKKYAELLEKESEHCTECSSVLERLVTLSDEYPRMLNSGRKGRQEYEKKTELIWQHLQSHGYKRKGYTENLYILIGVLIGIIIGLITKLVIKEDNTLLFIELMLGLIIGYIIGKIKEQRLIKEGKTV